MSFSEDLLFSNRAPTEVEESKLMQCVADHEHNLQGLTTRISELEAELHRLQAEKASALDTITPLKRALSPFRQLPEDIIREIFVACLETRRNPTMANTEAPMLLTQITSGLRRIALTTPALWAAIHIPVVPRVTKRFEHEAKSIMSRRAQGAADWLLRRSGILPLNISIHEPHESSSMTPENNIGEIVDILMACCARWKNMTFSCFPTFLTPLSSLTAADVPLLRSLTIYSGDFISDQDVTIWTRSNLLRTTRLKEFSLFGQGNIAEYPVNWSTLTHLNFPGTFSWRITGNGIDAIARILQQTPLLQSCSFSIFGHSLSLPSINGTISLPHLRLLRAEEHQPHANNTGILAAIDAPALEVLLYNRNIGVKSISGALLTLLKRSPKLQELSIGNPESPEILIEYLHHCRSLSSLHIRGTGYSTTGPSSRDETFLESFVVDDPTECLTPRLEYFRCDTALVVSPKMLGKFLTKNKETGLSAWKGVVIRVALDVLDQRIFFLELEETTSGIMPMKLQLSFVEKRRFSYLLSEGLDNTDPDVDWWPSKIKEIANLIRV